MIRRPHRLPPAVVVALLALSALSSGFSARDALANGRFPRAERLLEDPANPDRLVLSATYGLLTTHDRGAHWYHTCEAEFAGLSAYNGDPLVELVAGGGSLVNVQYEINRSTDDCAWTPTLGTLIPQGHEIIEDISVDRAGGRIAVAMVSAFVGNSVVTRVKESADGGLTWAVVGTPLPLSTAYTIDLDPSDPTHLYASGLSVAGAPALATSADHAATWTSKPITGATGLDRPYIAAIRPGTPAGVYVRTDSTLVNPDGTTSGNDALFYSGDGGSTWTQLLRRAAKLLGFALSPDGTTVLAGYGNDDSALTAAASQLGVFEAKTSDGIFAPVYAGQPVSCLTWTSQGTYVCTGKQTSAGFEQLVFFANGTLVAGTPGPTTLLRLESLLGPPPFCAETTMNCDWTQYCGFFGACPDAGAPPGMTDAAAAGDAFSARDASGDGSAGKDATASVDAPSADGDAPDSGRSPDAKSAGCGCRLSGVRGARGEGVKAVDGAASWGVVLSVALAWLTKRRIGRNGMATASAQGNRTRRS